MVSVHTLPTVMMSEPLRSLTDYLVRLGVGESFAQPLSILALVSATLLLAWVVDFATQRVLLRWVKAMALRTQTQWDDAMVDALVPDRLAHLAPAFVIYTVAPFIFPGQEMVGNIIQRIATAFMILSLALALNGALNAVVAVHRAHDRSGRSPIKTYIQVAQIVLAVITVVLVISQVIDRSPLALFSGIGALTAVIMLVFKDSILGFVASVQLTTNDMVRRGDWIEMPKYGADGDVIDVSLNTVKIQNWDKTISTIPTYQLMQDTFKNWRGMDESGGRRIKRALHIDMNSIAFCDDEMLQRFERIALLKEYLHEKRQDVAATNEGKGDADSPTNLRRLTNVGTFRAYMVTYLRAHPKIHKDMTFLVRQLPPGDRGLPIEIYVFSNDQDWARYEALQADLFDHFLAVLPEFGLRVFQLPSGADFVRSL